MPHSPARRVTRWRAHWLPILAGALAWSGMIVFTYPSVASWLSQYNQSQLIDGYSSHVRDGLDPSAAELIRSAHAYNDALTSGAVLGSNERVPQGDGSSTDETLEYEKQLRASPLDVMARLRIDAIGVDLPVYHGANDDTLSRGVGHLEGTSLPVGGMGTRSVLTAHRGLANATMFTNLDRVQRGDTFTVEVLGEVLTYRVFETQVVKPEDTESIRAVPGKDLITLVTCTPLGINTHRILVTGERITPTPQKDLDAAGGTPDVPGFPWWIVIIAGGTVAVGGYVWRSGRVPASQRQAEWLRTGANPER